MRLHFLSFVSIFAFIILSIVNLSSVLLTLLHTNVNINIEVMDVEFQKNLGRLLKDNKMRQADLCRLTGIQTSLMSEYLSGKKSPTLGNAILIADALNISLDQLVGKSSLTDAEKMGETKTFRELNEIIQNMSESEQLYLLDTVKALRKLRSQE